MNPETAATIRSNVYFTLLDYASIDGWREYPDQVPYADHRAELFCIWFDDMYHPDAPGWDSLFSEAERAAMASFNRTFEEVEDELPDDYFELLNSPQWAKVAEAAQNAASVFDPPEVTSDLGDRGPSQHELVWARLLMTRKDLNQVLDHIGSIPMTWAPREGMKTIAEMLCEIARKDHEIVSYLRNGVWPDDDPDPFDATTATLKEAREGLRSTRAATCYYLHGLSDAELDEIIELPERWWESLRLLQCPRSEMLRNISAHEWYHTGQLVTYLWMQGENPESW